ncbi:MAG: hypothetical protein OEM38_02995, partial [Gammaproteobacteria bacterium]|nr:hypothetical protein [Gammaproteobacteria bacterium]
LIPEITTQPENLSGIANFLRTLGIPQATLLPYNPLWQDKIEKLGTAARYSRSTLMSEDEKKSCVINFYHKS